MAHDQQHQHKHQHHHHHHDHGGMVSLNTAFKIGIILNATFVVVEAVFGFLIDSMGLLSDAGHNLSDVVSLVLAMIAFRLMKKSPDEKHTYGYRKFSIQASLINAILLLVAVGGILVESIDKLVNPVAVDGDVISWVAGAGVVINGITAWLFLKDKEKDINVKGAYLHMLADTLVSVGVVAAGVIIRFTGWDFIDPIIGIAIALLIGWSSRELLVESFRLSIDSVPDGIEMPKLIADLKKVEGVEGIHHIHVWALSTAQNAMTLHVMVDSYDHLTRIQDDITHIATNYGISHSTIQAETVDSHCHDTEQITGCCS